MKPAVVIGVFLFAVAIYFSDSLFGPRVFLDTSPYVYEPWADYASQEDLNEKTYRTDSFVTYLPRRYELTQSLRAGRLPLWNPYIFSGMPFFADPQSRVIYPVSLLLGAVSPTRAMGYDVAVHMLIAMIGMYLFLRAVGATTLASVLGAFSYAYSSFFYVRLGHPTFIAAGAWIPFLFFGYEKARMSLRRGILLLVGFFAMGYLAGFPQVLLFGTGALALYALLDGLSHARGQRRPHLLRSFRVFVAAGLLAVLIVSVQLVPFVELARNSTGLDIELEKMIDVFRAPPAMLLRSLAPNFFGHPVEGTDWSRLTRQVDHPYNPDFGIFTGVVTLVLALAGLVFLRESWRMRAFLALVLVSIGVAMSPQIIAAGYAVLPILKASKVSRISVLGCFALSALGALAFSRISEPGLDARQRRRFLIIVGCVVGVVVAGWVIFLLLGHDLVDSLVAKAQALPAKTWLKIHAQTRFVKLKEWAESGGAEWKAYEDVQAMRAVALALLTGGLAFAYVLSDRRRRFLHHALASALVLAGALDVTTVARTYSITQPARSFFETKSIGALKKDLGRTGTWRARSVAYKDQDIMALPPNTNMLFDIPLLNGTSTIVPDGYTHLFDAFTKAPMPAELATVEVPGDASEIMLNDFGSVRYIVASSSGMPFVVSPILRLAVARGGQTRPVRLLAVAGDSRMALVQGAGQTFNLVMDLPAVNSVDFAIGFDSRAAAPGESVSFWLSWEYGSESFEFSQAFDLFNDRSMWHPLRLDVKGAIGNRVRLKLGLEVSPEAAGDLAKAGWSGFDLVYDDCPVAKTPTGYRLWAEDGTEYVQVRLVSEAVEVPLRIDLGDGHSRHRWVGFPDDMRSRHVILDVRDRVGDTVGLQSDSTFRLEECKSVYVGQAYTDYQIVSDEDMLIYENFAAVEKGICLDKAEVEFQAAGDGPILKVAVPSLNPDVRCGTCKIVSYEPETVEMAVTADRDCYLLFQDTYYPGWKVFVDGSERPLLRTDVGMRAAELGRGTHRVTMAFRPRSLKIGLALTCMGVILTLAYAFGEGLWARFRHLRPRP